MRTSAVVLCCVTALLSPKATIIAAELHGVEVEFAAPAGAARVALADLGKHKLQIDVSPNGETSLPPLRVALPASGPNYWPAEDVEVLDSAGQPVPARHNGTQWHQFTIQVPPRPVAFLVHVVPVQRGRQRVFPEKERNVSDPATGARATVAKWYGGRRAALCIRFDDSHPTHLSRAIPMLRKHGFRGTFMINPGTRPDPRSERRRSPFQEHRGAWEAVAQRGDQEFANHTDHHRGAADDADMDHEIGDAARAIWRMFPHRSRLLALNLGGGTWWETKRTLRYYLDKYPSFLVSGSLGMDDTYGNRVDVFRQHLERNLKPSSLGWCKVHFHSIGPGGASSERNFRAVLDIAKQHEADLWIAGLADAYKYLIERRGSKLSIENRGGHDIAVKLICATDPELYDQPLTVEVMLPQSWEHHRVVVTDANGKPVTRSCTPTAGGLLLRFDVVPTSAAYRVALAG